MPKVDLSIIEQTDSTGYPAPYDRDVAGRLYRRVGAAMGLGRLGISQCTLQPGAWSSQRHWHEGEDELLVMIAGEAVLVEDDGRTVLRAGDVAAWPKDVASGHHLINESEAPCRFLVVGRPATSDCHYPDIDLHLDGQTDHYLHHDRTPY